MPKGDHYAPMMRSFRKCFIGCGDDGSLTRHVNFNTPRKPANGAVTSEGLKRFSPRTSNIIHPFFAANDRCEPRDVGNIENMVGIASLACGLKYQSQVPYDSTENFRADPSSVTFGNMWTHNIRVVAEFAKRSENLIPAPILVRFRRNQANAQEGFTELSASTRSKPVVSGF